LHIIQALFVKFVFVKATLIIKNTTRKQLEAMLQFLREPGIGVKVTYEDADTHSVSMVSEPSLAEAWNSEEDERWNHYGKNN
jgi:hypothetical protein